MKITDKIEFLRTKREDLETQLSEIGEIEQLMRKYGFNMDEVLTFDEAITRKWADVCCELNDLLEIRLARILGSLDAMTKFDNWNDEQMAHYHELEDERVKIMEELYPNN